MTPETTVTVRHHLADLGLSWVLRSLVRLRVHENLEAIAASFGGRLELHYMGSICVRTEPDDDFGGQAAVIASFVERGSRVVLAILRRHLYGLCQRPYYEKMPVSQVKIRQNLSMIGMGPSNSSTSFARSSIEDLYVVEFMLRLSAKYLVSNIIMNRPLMIAAKSCTSSGREPKKCLK